MSLEIKTEEIIPEVKELDGVSKSFQKLQKIADKLVIRLNAHNKESSKRFVNLIEINNKSTQEKVDAFISSTNEGIGSFKKRYEALYSDLVRRILLKMEQRLFNVEIFNQAILDISLSELYETKKQLASLEWHSKAQLEGSEFAFESYDEFIKRMARKHEEVMQKLANDMAKKMEEANNMAKKMEEVHGMASEKKG